MPHVISRFDALFDALPDARVVWLHRAPEASVASCCSLCHAIWSRVHRPASGGAAAAPNGAAWRSQVRRHCTVAGLAQCNVTALAGSVMYCHSMACNVTALAGSVLYCHAMACNLTALAGSVAWRGLLRGLWCLWCVRVYVSADTTDTTGRVSVSRVVRFRPNQPINPRASRASSSLARAAAACVALRVSDRPAVRAVRRLCGAACERSSRGPRTRRRRRRPVCDDAARKRATLSPSSQRRRRRKATQHAHTHTHDQPTLERSHLLLPDERAELNRNRTRNDRTYQNRTEPESEPEPEPEPESESEPETEVVEYLARMIDLALDFRVRRPDAAVFDLRMDDLVAEPLAAVERIYKCAVTFPIAVTMTVHYSRAQLQVRVTYHHTTLRYSTVQYSTVQYSTVQYSTVQYSTVQYRTLHYGRAHLQVRRCTLRRWRVSAAVVTRGGGDARALLPRVALLRRVWASRPQGAWASRLQGRHVM